MKRVVWLGGAIMLLLIVSMGMARNGAPRYALSVAEAVTRSQELEGRSLVLRGVAVGSSVRSDPQGCIHRFELEDRGTGAVLPTTLEACGSPPPGLRPDDLAADQPRVIVRGTMVGGTLHARSVKPDCWSKYSNDILYMRACYEAAGWSEEAIRNHLADVRASRAQRAGARSR